METQALTFDGCVLINDVPEDFVPIAGAIEREITARTNTIRGDR